MLGAINVGSHRILIENVHIGMYKIPIRGHSFHAETFQGHSHLAGVTSKVMGLHSMVQGTDLKQGIIYRHLVITHQVEATI